MVDLCSGCRFYSPSTGARLIQRGECRYEVPAIVYGSEQRPGTDGETGIWPKVEPGWWCGRFAQGAPAQVTCLTCTHYAPSSGASRGERGECRREAPDTVLRSEIRPVQEGLTGKWPKVDASWWCGQWAAILPQAPARPAALPPRVQPPIVPTPLP